MISRADIIAWKTIAPWQSEAHVEQDLVISRALVEIFSDDILSKNLAFRGGTALHKLFIDNPLRYSEDIDLVQMKPEGIGKVIDRLREKLNFLGKATVNQKEFNNTIVFKYESEIPPVVPMKLKVEINCREHFSVFGYKKIPYTVSSNWFKGKCDITTFELGDMLGTKMRALYQRRKGRDLFDLYFALSETNVQPKQIVKAFRKYMDYEGKIVTKKQFIINMEDKLQEDMFANDIKNLIRPEVKFDISSAWVKIQKELIELL